MNLRELTIEQQQILDAVENGDFTPEQVSDHLDGITQAREEKIEGCLHVLNQIERHRVMIATEYDRLELLEAPLIKKLENIREWLLSNMEDGERHEFPLFKISKVKGRQMVQVNDKTKLGSYITEEIVEKLDKRTLLADLKNGEVEGAELATGKSSLRIK